MKLDEYRTSFAWQSALEMAPHLVRIAEQLPEGETAGLGAKLRTLAAEVPGSIASDLVTGSRSSLSSVLGAVAALEVIERVYPALDTAAARAAADSLAERVAGPNFDEREASAAPAVPAELAEAVQTATESAPSSESPAPVAVADTMAAPSEPQPSPTAPAASFGVPVVAAPAPTLAPAPSVPVSVPTEAPNVQPDSPQ
ncbi:hypothetical protein HJC99_06745 [Candidatus Saccharibacteria bacterium]|nr:hypothetical protein [Candidatus Saccharibacteria bacterium]